MNALQDMILPSVIIGMLLTLILGVQMMMVESSVENRVTQDLQGFADITVQVIQEEVRTLNSIEEITDSTLIYRDSNNHLVSISKAGRDLRVIRTLKGDTLSVNDHALRLSGLSFEMIGMHHVSDQIIRIRVITESTPDQEVGNRTHRHRAFSHKDIFLRNLNL
jgi:PAS domain-containing protein